MPSSPLQDMSSANGHRARSQGHKCKTNLFFPLFTSRQARRCLTGRNHAPRDEVIGGPRAGEGQVWDEHVSIPRQAVSCRPAYYLGISWELTAPALPSHPMLGYAVCFGLRWPGRDPLRLLLHTQVHSTLPFRLSSLDATAARPQPLFCSIHPPPYFLFPPDRSRQAGFCFEQYCSMQAANISNVLLTQGAQCSLLLLRPKCVAVGQTLYGN